MVYSSFASALQNSIAGWSKDLERIQDPDAAFDAELAKLHDQAREQLEKFALNPKQENLPLIQQELLLIGRQITELELDYAAIRMHNQHTCEEAAQALADKMFGELIDISGSRILQSSSIEPISPEAGQTHETSPILHEHSSSNQNLTETKEFVSQTNEFHAMVTRAVHQVPLPSTDSHAAGHTGIKRNRDASIETIEEQRPHKRSRLFGDGVTRHDPPVSLFAGPDSPYEHKTSQMAFIRRMGLAHTRKAIRLGENGHIISLAAFYSPSHKGWVCAMHVPEGQTVPSIDAMVAEKLRTDPSMRHLGLYSSEVDERPIDEATGN
ncbi:hypothetical protein CEP54_014103 [Fusarium duplospermum]|uniref:Uncharacterized protein n=1 Tax=Fusarium duplospermum TaxID=1325734 RepID=A0A428NYR8_9HYPO|nr:hypothetical protein CEP54_014103 [Fusarium duplospermum]